MIPILYDKTETTFTSNGLGRLADCTRCIVTEERNGIYECEFDYPISGEKYGAIEEGQIIAVTHDDNGDLQPFDIYHREAPMDGIVTFYARHISYRQNGITVKPYSTTTNISDALQGLKTNSIGDNPFNYWTDKTTEGEYTLTVPDTLKSLLGGEENSLLDVFGSGEYEYDRFTTKLWTRRGSDTNVEIRYGKNLSDIKNDVDFGDSYNGIVPYWFGTVHVDGSGDDDPGEDVDTLVTLPEWAIYAEGTTYDGRNTVLPLELSQELGSEVPTVDALRAAAEEKLNASDTLKAITNIEVSFVQLWQTKEYADVAPLQKVSLCDTVKVIYPELGVTDTRVKVIRTEYNVLLDRYDAMELGDSVSSYAAVVTAGNSSKIAQLEDGLLMVSTAAQNAQNDADIAHRAATSAQADAGDALIAAQNAVTSAGNALTAAQNAEASASSARDSADEAKIQAGTANVYASSALDQLSIVQNVVGVLDLLSTNADYQLTSDTEVVAGKWYFTRSGTSPDYVYTVVANPVAADIGSYYEIVSIDEAVQNYVTSRLSVTADGLWIQEPSMQSKILLSADDGVVLYGTDGTVVGKYGSTAQIGDAAGFHIEMDGTELGFYQAQKKVAYISNNQLYITQSVVLQQMDLGIPVNDGGLGQWSWKVHANGANPSRNNLNLKWIG